MHPPSVVTCSVQKHRQILTQYRSKLRFYGGGLGEIGNKLYVNLSLAPRWPLIHSQLFSTKWDLEINLVLHQGDLWPTLNSSAWKTDLGIIVNHHAQTRVLRINISFYFFKSYTCLFIKETTCNMHTNKLKSNNKNEILIKSNQSKQVT